MSSYRGVFSCCPRVRWCFAALAGLLISGLCLSATSRAADTTIRAASYNIRHGRGTDGRLDLERTAGVLKTLQADVIGLQEVDNKCRRSAQVDQAEFLGNQLKMHAVFGKFMDYDGGRYGMAILSRYPIVRTTEVKLPAGGEPRIALIAELQLPRNRRLSVVNVHFDWVTSDAVRFKQAQTLATHLRSLKTPYLLLGDFNDQPESRTLQLFYSLAVEAEKPEESRFTFSSDRPKIEIDFIFAAPAKSWQVGPATVIPAKVTSDHFPVTAELKWLDDSAKVR